MLVGAPNAGKTCVLKVLSKTLCLLKERQFGDEEAVVYHTVNPKSVTMGQLFGQFDPVTHEVKNLILFYNISHFVSLLVHLFIKII